MFIGQSSSVVGVCVVYGLSSLVHPLLANKNPLIHEEKGHIHTHRKRVEREREIKD
jgi:hypothetical protein